jgi:GT2 family glycosyltransferase
MSGRPIDERECADGVFGWLESPRPHDVSLDCVLISGWTFSRTSRVTDVSARIGNHRWSVEYGMRRDDVKAAYPADAGAAQSGFLTFVEIDRAAPKPERLEVWCRLENGRDVRLFTRRLRSRRLVRIARRSLGQVRARLVNLIQPQAVASEEQAANPNAREMIERDSRLALRAFLVSGATLRFQEHPAPSVSIVVVLWNRAELTLRCLRAVPQPPELPVELVLVDNQSTDETPVLLTRIAGATIVRNTSNLGFTVAANVGARAARGNLLLFLNNDAEMLPGALERLVATLRSSPDIGVVGGKQVFPDGRLQEAGSIVWSDGSCEAYGRNADPDAGEFNFQRDVDYCSGAFLLTRRELFRQLGGFDERYQPAYYEDVDYCVRLWESGYRVVYQPGALVIHLEFGSASSPTAAIKLQQERRSVFSALHKEWLSSQYAKADGTWVARMRRRGRRSVLVIDDAWPEPRLGSGFPRAAALLRALVDLDSVVTFYPMNAASRPTLPSDALAKVEVIDRCGIEHLRTFLESRRGLDAVVVSRPHNLQYVKAAMGSDLSELGAPVVYDAEAVYALREIGRRRIAGSPLSFGEEQALIDQELRLARGCAAVLTVNEIERFRFLEAGAGNVVVLGHALRLTPTEADFDSRRGLLFVGALGADSPNEDAVIFLVRDVLPALERSVRQSMPLTIVGANVSERVTALAGDHVTVLSNVIDLVPLYAAARVFVAPTRYSAGIPLKLFEAAARGVPIVCTPQLARQLGWQPGRDLMTGESPVEIAQAIDRVSRDRRLWQQLRDAALLRVGDECVPEVFYERIHEVLDETMTRARSTQRVPEISQ